MKAEFTELEAAVLDEVACDDFIWFVAEEMGMTPEDFEVFRIKLTGGEEEVE